MKKIWALLFLILFSTSVYAADTKISGLTEDTAPTSDDLTVTVNDPGGSPGSRRVTLGNLWFGIFKSGIAASRPATCTEPDSYWATDTNVLSFCTATDTWTQIYESSTSNDFDPDRLAGDTVDNNLIDEGIIDSAIARDSELHNAITLDTTINTNLLSLSTQVLGLDNQNANIVFSGPSSGGAAAPSFRSLVSGDIHDLSGTYSITAHAHASYTVGAASSTDNALSRFDGTGGKTIQNSGVIVDDSNFMTGLAKLTMANDTLIDLSEITMSGTNDEGITLPYWANVTPTSDKRFFTWDDTADVIKIYKSGTGWITINPAAGAPTDVAYAVIGSGSGSLSAERVLTEGLAIDFVDGGANSTYTISFDPTELTGDRTWAAGGSASIIWTWNLSAGDPTITFGNATITLSQMTSTSVNIDGGTIDGTAIGGATPSTGAFSTISASGLVSANAGLTVATGQNVTVGTTQWNSGDEIDGTKIKDADYGDIGVSAAGVWSVEDDSHAHGSTTITLASTNLSDTANIAYNNTAENISGTWEIQDNININFGNDADWGVLYDESGTDTLTFTTSKTGALAATDPMFLIKVNSGAGTLTADQIIFEIKDNTTSKFSVDEDGDVVIGGALTTTAPDGSRYMELQSNTTISPSVNRLYVEGNVWTMSENGTEKDIVTPSDSVTWTGTSHSFIAVTNFAIPTATPDSNGEIGINNTNETFMMYINSGLKTLDFSGDSAGYVLKSDGAGLFTLQADATGGSPTLDTVGDPVTDSTIVMDAGEEVLFQYTGAFTTGSQFMVQQVTGNPSGGVLFEVRAADTDVTAARIGDGTNYSQFASNGTMTLAGTALINAGGIVLGDSTPDANGEIGYATNAFALFANSEDMIITASANLWTFNSNTSAVFAFTPALTATTQLNTPKVAWTDNITIDAVNAAANTTVAVGNSAATYVANLSVDGGITGGTAGGATALINLGADPADTGTAINLANATSIAWEDGTAVTLTHVDNVGLATNLNFSAATYGSNGSVSDAELLYLGDVTSAIQAQFTGKQATLTNSAGLLAALDDETGTGLAVFNNSPMFVDYITFISATTGI